MRTRSRSRDGGFQREMDAVKRELGERFKAVLISGGNGMSEEGGTEIEKMIVKLVAVAVDFHRQESRDQSPSVKRGGGAASLGEERMNAGGDGGTAGKGKGRDRRQDEGSSFEDSDGSEYAPECICRCMCMMQGFKHSIISFL